MEISYDSTDGEQSVTVEHEGAAYTATRAVGSGENYQFEDPNQAPVEVRQAVQELNPEGVFDPEPDDGPGPDDEQAENGGNNE